MNHAMTMNGKAYKVSMEGLETRREPQHGARDTYVLFSFFIYSTNIYLHDILGSLYFTASTTLTTTTTST